MSETATLTSVSVVTTDGERYFMPEARVLGARAGTLYVEEITSRDGDSEQCQMYPFPMDSIVTLDVGTDIEDDDNSDTKWSLDVSGLGT